MTSNNVNIVLVSNRGPVSFLETGDGGFETKRGAGGLAGALDPVARRLGDRAVWIAAATSNVDRAALRAGAVDELRDRLGYPVKLIDIDEHVYDLYYNNVSNRMLWFANHCLWDELGIDRFGEDALEAFNEAYEPVNEMFARKIIETSAPDALVLFQDYHLATAPGHLRRLGDRHAISHFTHSSFCGPEGLDRCPAPVPRSIIEGMLGADLLGFHIPAWCEAFFRCCERIDAVVDRVAGTVRFAGRRTWVRPYPIPIDAPELQERALGSEASAWAKRFREKAGGPLIVRADRAELSKNVVRGFEAFGRLLDRRPDLRGAVHFIACLYPSRQSMPEYRDYMERIRRSTDEVNARHPDSIRLFLKDDYNRTLGALRVYDVLFVNSIMDGMNLVSKEGPAVNERSGALILSREAGSFAELGDHAVIIHDPYDVDETAAAIETALEMPAAERERHARALREIVEKSRPQDWIQAQLDDLEAISRGGEPQTPASPSN